MSARRRVWALALAAALLAPPPAVAFADETSPANVAAARRHFEKARADYAQGAYREAIAELEAARALDPNAKDLVFNLGVVHEKLADIDEALKWFRLYTAMNLTAQERERAEAYVRRLKGAKSELDARQADAAPPPQAPAAGTPVAPAAAPFGRLDAFTITGASVTAASLAFGIVMAIKAEGDQPPPNYVTGRTGTFTQLQNQVNQSHQEAVLADVGFGVALAAAAATAYLYLGRGRGAAPATTGSTTVSAAPSMGGGAVFVQGSF